MEDVEGTLELEWDCSPVAAPTFNRPPGAAAAALALALALAFTLLAVDAAPALRFTLLAVDAAPALGFTLLAVDAAPALAAPPPLAACEAEAPAARTLAAVVAPRVAIARPRAMSCGGAEPGGPGGCVARQ